LPLPHPLPPAAFTLSLHDALPISGFVADLFPVLHEFIQTQLKEQPADLLATAWPVMLAHHEFFTNTMATCAAEWDHAGVPELMRSEEQRLNSSHSQISYAVFCLKK